MSADNYSRRGDDATLLRAGGEATLLACPV